MGTPIRLVRNDGGIIELMATTMTMNVDRGVTPLPMPFAGGSRFAFDLNLPKSLITIEGVMTDDDLINTGLQREANATIDFSRFHGDSADSAARWDASFTSNGILDGVTNNDITTATHAIKINNTHEVWLVKSSSANQGLDGGSGRYYITIHNNTTARSAADIAASLVSLVTTYSSTFALTAATINSPTDGTANTAVFLTQVNKGKSGNMTHPSFGTWPTASTSTKPYHLKYSGGRDSSSSANKSAGDKVAELYAVLNNSNNGGSQAMIGGGLIGFGENVKNILKGNLEFSREIGQELKYGDYIIAIQIPFSSNINSNESLFYIPTGGMRVSTDKTADRAKPAGTKFNLSERRYTGIKGSVANATFVQLGGEPIYSYTINFAPVDWIF